MRRVSIWSHPRSRSTALERYFENRGDVETRHETLADFYYVLKQSEHIDHLDLDHARGRTYEDVAAELSATYALPLVHKDFPYHAIDQLLSDDRWLSGLHVVLIRHPREALYSLMKLRDKVSTKNFGYVDLSRWHAHLARHDAEVMVVDSGQMNSSPASTIRSICEFTGLPFDAGKLRWNPGMSTKWKTWATWHSSVAETGSLGRPPAMPPGWAPPRTYTGLYEEALTVYDQLANSPRRLVAQEK